MDSKNPRTTLRRSVQKLKELCERACKGEEQEVVEEETQETEDVHDMIEYINNTPLKKAVVKQKALSARIRNE